MRSQSSRRRSLRRVPALLRRLVHERRGAVALEYVITFAFVGVAIAAAVAAVAPRAVRDYSTQRALLYSHQP